MSYNNAQKIFKMLSQERDRQQGIELFISVCNSDREVFTFFASKIYVSKDGELTFPEEMSFGLAIQLFNEMLVDAEYASSITSLNFSNKRQPPARNNLHLLCNLEELILVNIAPQKIPDLTSFHKLRVLKLISCGIKELPFLPKTLQVLNISSNPIASFPDEVLSLENLHSLFISKCLFTTLPDMRSLHNLHYLSLCSSLVENLEPLVTIPNLKKLRIGYRGLDYPNLTDRHPNIPCPEIIPYIPKGLSITDLYVHGLIRVEFGAYTNHTLNVLDIHRSTEGVGQHLLKQFQYIKKIIGFVMHGTLPNNDALIPKMR